MLAFSTPSTECGPGWHAGGPLPSPSTKARVSPFWAPAARRRSFSPMGLDPAVSCRPFVPEATCREACVLPAL